MNEEIKEKTEKLKPFTKFCMTIGQLPASYVESMSYYEQLIWFTKYLQDQVIPAVNHNAAAVDELQKLFIDLQKYVDDYFKDLNIQEEINNKLDEMVDDGTLYEILSSYTNIKISVPAAINSDAVTSSCFILKVNDKSIMYDLGHTASYSNITTELSNLSITHLDVVIISHFDADHAGNYRNIIDNYCDEHTLFYIGIVPTDMTNWNGSLDLYNSFTSYMNSIEYEYSVPTNNSSISLFNIFDLRFFNTDIESISYYENYTGEYSNKPTLNLLSLCCEINILNQFKIYLDGDAELPTQLLNINYINPCDIYYGNHHATNLNGYFKYFDRLNPQMILLSLNSTSTPANYLSKYMYFNKEIDVLSTQSQTKITLEVKNRFIKIISGNKYINSYYNGNSLFSVDQVLPFYNDYTHIVEDNNTKTTWTIKNIFDMLPYVKQNVSFYVDSTRTALFNEIKSLFSDLLNYSPTQYFVTLHSLYIEIIPNSNWCNISMKILRGYIDKTTSENNVILSIGDKMQINASQNLTANNETIKYRNELKAMIQIKDSTNDNVYEINCNKSSYGDNEFNGSKVMISKDETHTYLTILKTTFTISNSVLNVTLYSRTLFTFTGTELTGINEYTTFVPYRIKFIL